MLMEMDRLLAADSAAGMLSGYLGRDFDYWMKELKLDGRRVERNRYFRFTDVLNAHGHSDEGLVRYYFITDIYKFIARRNPSSLGYRHHESGCAQGTTYRVEAGLHCDYANAGVCSVLLKEESVFFGDRRLTIQGAKHLAQQILKIVDFCESHEFNHEECEFVPRENTSNSRFMKMLMNKPIFLSQPVESVCNEAVITAGGA